jgi:hypothetical protein
LLPCDCQNRIVLHSMRVFPECQPKRGSALGQGSRRRRSTGVQRFSGRALKSRRLQEMSERFQRRFGNVMLNSLGVGLRNLGRDT